MYIFANYLPREKYNRVDKICAELMPNEKYVYFHIVL